MNDLVKYSLPNMLAALRAYRKKEGLQDEGILGLGVATFVVLLLISIALWIVAIVLLVKHAHEMPSWAVIVAIIALIIPSLGPIVTILMALLIRK